MSQYKYSYSSVNDVSKVSSISHKTMALIGLKYESITYIQGVFIKLCKLLYFEATVRCRSFGPLGLDTGNSSSQRVVQSSGCVSIVDIMKLVWNTVSRMMGQTIEQRYAIKFCVNSAKVIMTPINWLVSQRISTSWLLISLAHWFDWRIKSQSSVDRESAFGTCSNWAWFFSHCYYLELNLCANKRRQKWASQKRGNCSVCHFQR